ncbi:hypothetical protein WJR50_14160 [Catalinimonas sp. 4WD22]|uniref:hypothetical protein n=1 Tax=Catalinimonas locisalis TaxID=3133978 RepID=UPI0031011746
MIKQNLFIQQTYIALQNVLSDAEMLSLLGKFSYNEKKLKEALNSLLQLKVLRQMHYEAMGQSRLATAQLKQARNTLLAIFRIHQDTAKLAYKREADYHDHLNICGKRRKATADWLADAERFYELVPAAMMDKYNVPLEELTQTKQMVQQVMQLLATQALAKARAQDLTQQKQQQMEKMELWMRQFYKVAKVALSDSPQQMEALGIVVPS